MARSVKGPGDDLDAWCTRCRMDLNHIVIAVVGSEVKKVQCLTCGSDHKYYPPKGGDRQSKKAVKVRAPSKGRSASIKENQKASAKGEWTRFMAEMAEGEVPRAYRATEVFSPGDYVEHPTFGVGRVLDIVASQKVEVAFEEGRKILLFNRTASK